jgi:hypothetical protein
MQNSKNSTAAGKGTAFPAGEVYDPILEALEELCRLTEEEPTEIMRPFRAPADGTIKTYTYPCRHSREGGNPAARRGCGFPTTTFGNDRQRQGRWTVHNRFGFQFPQHRGNMR